MGGIRRILTGVRLAGMMDRVYAGLIMFYSGVFRDFFCRKRLAADF
jgi:hypothetical protein